MCRMGHLSSRGNKVPVAGRSARGVGLPVEGVAWSVVELGGGVAWSVVGLGGKFCREFCGAG